MGFSGIRDRDRGAAGQQCETTDGGSMEGRVGSAQYKPRLDRNCQQLPSLLAKSSVNSKTATCSTAAHPPANKATAAHSSSSPLHLGSFAAIEIVNWSCEGFCFSLLKYRSATLQAAAAHTPSREVLHSERQYDYCSKPSLIMSCYISVMMNGVRVCIDA